MLHFEVKKKNKNIWAKMRYKSTPVKQQSLSYTEAI